MNTKIKQILKTITLSLTALLLVTTGAYAIGTLTPSGTAGDDTQYSLNDIYDKLTNFSDTPTATSSPFTVPGTVEATFNTLSEIYALLEAEEADLVPENIADGVTVFGVAGTLEGATELEWSAQTDNQTWTQATLLCSTLTEGSVPAGTWRLPTRYELVAAIVDDHMDGSGSVFPADTYYWSGTELNGSTAYYADWWVDNFSDANSNNKTTTYSVRCVR